MTGKRSAPTRSEREQALLMLLPDGHNPGARFTAEALTDELLVNLLLEISVLGGPKEYDLARLREEELSYLEACCCDPRYLEARPSSAS